MLGQSLVCVCRLPLLRRSFMSALPPPPTPPVHAPAIPNLAELQLFFMTEAAQALTRKATGRAGVTAVASSYHLAHLHPGRVPGEPATAFPVRQSLLAAVLGNPAALVDAMKVTNKRFGAVTDAALLRLVGHASAILEVGPDNEAVGWR